MKFRLTASILTAAVCLSVGAIAASAQSGESGRTPSSAAPRTAWGHPDLQGVWSIATLTPFERPSTLADKQVLTEQEAAELEKQTLVNNNQDRRDGAGTDADVARAYNDFWWDRGTKLASTRQTALVIDPPDGRVPALTSEGQARATARAARGFNSWEERSLWERCITRGLPMVPGPYNNNYQILQTPTHVVILHEMIHDARIIPIDGRPHVSGNVRQWFGDSRGRWEGDTLVVTTKNFSDKANFRGAADKLTLIERFTRVAPDTVRYEFTIDDPSTFTKKWTAAIPMSQTDEQIYEYACHEGNYGMVNLLSGARAQEK